MKITNPLQMNDWPIKKFLIVIFSVQVAVLLLIGLDALGWQLSGLRQVVVFIYLFYFPGIIILRILRLHKRGNVETLLYSVGLSITTLMLTGWLMNMVYPLLGITRPISIIPLIITLSVLILVLCIASYWRDRDFNDPDYINNKMAFSPPALFLYLLPFLSIFGTYLVNSYHNNILLLILIAAVMVIIFLIGINRWIPKELYPLAITSIAISLVLSRTLISNYITGTDIHEEYYVANLVIKNGIWDSSYSIPYNTVLSVTMFVPVNSIMCAVDLTWVMKVIFPLLLALCPLGLYRVFQRQTDDRIAFLSCLFFMATIGFLNETPTIMRQILATLFISLFLLVFLDRKIPRLAAIILCILFSFSMIVSHYGLPLIFMLCLLIWLILRSPITIRIFKTIFRFKSSQPSDSSNTELHHNLPTVSTTIGTNFVLLFILITLSWYMYVSGSVTFEAMVRFGSHIVNNLRLDFLIEWPQQVILTAIEKYSSENALQFIVSYVGGVTGWLIELSIIVGIFIALFKRTETRLVKDYLFLSIPMFIIYLVCIPLPFSVAILSFLGIALGRFIHIATILLSPYLVFGSLWLLRMLFRIVKLSKPHIVTRVSFALISFLMIVYLAFNTGFIREFTGYSTWSSSLNQESVKKSDEILDRIYLYSNVIPEQDVFGARWLSNNMKTGTKVYATYDDLRVHSLTSYGMIPVSDVAHLTANTEGVEKTAYIYLQYLNVIEGIGTEFDITQPMENRITYYEINENYLPLQGKNKIYSNGSNYIFE